MLWRRLTEINYTSHKLKCVRHTARLKSQLQEIYACRIYCHFPQICNVSPSMIAFHISYPILAIAAPSDKTYTLDINDNKTIHMQNPLCVDLDGSLIKTDLLHESLLLLLKQHPFAIFLLPFWLLKGKAYFKNKIAERVQINFKLLPYNEDVISVIKETKAKKRKTILVTASPQSWADGIKKELKVFDEAIGTGNDVNLSGDNKASYLVNRFGEKGFDYVGNAKVDLPVWQRAAGAIVVASNASLPRAAAQLTEVKKHVELNKKGLVTYLKALRIHQWIKNVLIWLPIAAAHQLSNVTTLLQGLYAFLAFSLCASAVYLINDLFDLESDRAHVRKCKRPFAAGLIPVHHGLFLAPALLIASVIIALQLPIEFLLVLGFYFIMTLAYSLRLKQQVILDVLILGGLYTIRIIAGAAATQIIPSFWMLGFSMFVFFSLALIKRYSELLVTLQQQKSKTAGRGYEIADLPVLMSMGASSGVAAVMVLALYVNSPESTALYQQKFWLWLAPPVFLYWIARFWMKAHRGQVDDDPIVFAIKDWQSILTCALLFGLILLAI